MFAPAGSIVQFVDFENFVGVETNKYMHTIIPGRGGAPASPLSVIRTCKYYVFSRNFIGEYEAVEKVTNL